VTDLKLGILLWSQATEWRPMLETARRLDKLGYDHLWTWDHIYAIFGDPSQPIFEGWSVLCAWAAVTERVRLGLLVGANTFRNPGLVAKQAATLDHISGGRAIEGIGAAWFELEHQAHGLEFGRSPGQRLDWLDQSVGVIRQLLDGKEVTHHSEKYDFERLVHHPLPVQPHLPIMIGGSGEKKTLRTVAKYADMWNGMGPLDMMAHKVDVLKQHCADVGRDVNEIEFTLGVKLTIRDSEAEAVRVWKAAMEANRTPCRGSIRTARSGTARRNRSPSGCDRTWISASEPSSQNSRRLTTRRRSSASSARSSRWSILAEGRRSNREQH